LRLLLCVTICCDAGTFIVLCVTAEETLPVFRNSLVPAKCFTRAKLTCPMIMPLVPCMLITCTLVVEYRICKETSKKRAKLWTLHSSARLEGLRAELSDSMRLGSASLLATCQSRSWFTGCRYRVPRSLRTCVMVCHFHEDFVVFCFQSRVFIEN